MPITFTYAGFTVASQNATTCDVCGAMVLESSQEVHIDYHGAMNYRMERIQAIITSNGG